MLWTIAVILLICWLLGFSFHVAGGLNSPSLGISRDRRGHKARARASSVSLGVRCPPSRKDLAE